MASRSKVYSRLKTEPQTKTTEEYGSDDARRQGGDDFSNFPTLKVSGGNRKEIQTDKTTVFCCSCGSWEHQRFSFFFPFLPSLCPFAALLLAEPFDIDAKRKALPTVVVPVLRFPHSC
mmetsp:Transcript_9689/g.18226  ORF Transcript_9689/g.18226 Transcript_9689/m.18226 type:complete len:118 (-) Transcript_9689:122-475(-)